MRAESAGRVSGQEGVDPPRTTEAAVVFLDATACLRASVC